MSEGIYKIEGMTCGGCVGALERALKVALPEAQVEVTLEPGRARIGGAHEASQVRVAVEAAGFTFGGAAD